MGSLCSQLLVADAIILIMKAKIENQMLRVRPAKLSDLNAITEIYNEAILTTNATFDTDPKTVAEQKVWFTAHDARHPIMVIERDKIVVGWASLSEWSGRCAYADTAEISIYIKPKFRNQGIGRKLMSAVMREGERIGLHTVIARITEGNQHSLHLHEKAGFENIGVMREVGRKFGKLLDVRLMQRIYPPKKKAND
jgi:L-amino acid N-acyltransferase YncA